jgi:hypothetical protein
MPKPILYADVGGGAGSIPPPPGETHGGFLYSQEGIDVVYPKCWNDLLILFKQLWKQEPSAQAKQFGDRYATVALDHLTECNFHLILNEVAGGPDQRVTQNDWGVIGKKTKQLVRIAKELTESRLHKEGPHVIITALRSDKSLDSEGGIFTGRIGPMLSGQCFSDVPCVPDIVLQNRVVTRPDPATNKNRRVRMIQLESDGMYMARCRHRGPGKFEPPNMTAVWEKIQDARAKSRTATGNPIVASPNK